MEFDQVKLIKQAEDCRILLNAILGGADLNYNETRLVLDGYNFDPLIKAMFPAEYKETFDRLKAAAEQKRKEDEA